MPSPNDFEFLRQLLVDLVANRLDKIDDNLIKVLNKLDDHESRIKSIEAVKEAGKENNAMRDRFMDNLYKALSIISVLYILLHEFHILP